MSRLDGTVALVTGATGLIGGAVARQLAARGATVLVGSRSADSAAAWIGREDAPGRYVPFVVDLDDPPSIAAAVAGLDETPRIVIGAASARTWLVGGDEPGRDAFAGLFAADVGGHYDLAAQIVARLPEGVGASVVLLSSVYATAGVDRRIYPDGMQATPVHYAAAKAGVLGMVQWCAAAWAPRVRVNAVIAGGVRNPDRQPEEFVARYSARTMAGRMAEPDEVASACVFLASDDASYVTGTALTVDGGLTGW